MARRKKEEGLDLIRQASRGLCAGIKPGAPPAKATPDPDRYSAPLLPRTVPMRERDAFDDRVRGMAERCGRIRDRYAGQGRELMDDALKRAAERRYSCCSPHLVLGYYTRTPLTSRLYRDACRKNLLKRPPSRTKRYHEYLLDAAGEVIGSLYHTDEIALPPRCPMYTAVIREGEVEYLLRYALNGENCALKELYSAEYSAGRIVSYHFFHVKLGTVGFLQLFDYDGNGGLEGIRLFQAPMRMPGAEQTLRNMLSQPVTRQEIEVYTEAPYAYTEYDLQDREDGADADPD